MNILTLDNSKAKTTPTLTQSLALFRTIQAKTLRQQARQARREKLRALWEKLKHIFVAPGLTPSFDPELFEGSCHVSPVVKLRRYLEVGL